MSRTTKPDLRKCPPPLDFAQDAPNWYSTPGGKTIRAVSSKKFQRKTCVYCGIPGASDTADHVIAREFFPEGANRANLPQAPACWQCNNEKSKLEHYAATVLPFGASHTESHAILSNMVPGRLAHNRKLARELAEGSATHFVSRDNGRSWDIEMTLPFDSVKIAHLFQMIARGLAYVEWGIVLPDAECVVHADFLSADGRLLFDRFFAGEGNQTGRRNLGNGIFVYDGVQSLESPQLTLLRMSFGVMVGGDPKARGERVSVVYALTAPRKMSAASRLVEFLRSESAQILSVV